MTANRGIRQIHQSDVNLTKRTLVLTFDAFETLYHPFEPIAKQYASVAHYFGLSSTLVTEERLRTSFKDVFKAQVKKRPNYGREDVLRGEYRGPRQWWDEVIRLTFEQAMRKGEDNDVDGDERNANKKEGTYAVVPEALVESLLDRFSSSEGYKFYDDVVPFLEKMERMKCIGNSNTAWIFDRVLLGVISNSDDRVFGVLKSLGLTGRAVQHGLSSSNKLAPIDFVITSYEAGEEKPSRAIFDVAKREAHRLADREGDQDGHKGWVYVHVGDHYEKDYRAAINAGWNSYFLLREKDSDENGPANATTIHSLMDLFTELERKYS